MEFAFENHVIEDGGGGGEGGGEEVHRDVQDDLSWVLHQVHSLGHTCEEADVTPAMLEVLHSLFSERNHWQNQSQSLSEFSSELKGKVNSLEKERELHRNEITMLKQDLNISAEKNNALRSEHREVKCQWLNEKSELESRHFQTMALNTQIQGTLRKKERDYDRLQNQLSKVATKPTTRGGKTDPSASAPIVITKPLKRNFSQQGNPNEGTLQMAEVSAAKATISSLEMENENLRVAVEDLTQNFEEFQANMTKMQLENNRLAEENAKSHMVATPEASSNETNNDENLMDEEEAFERMSCLDQAKYVERRLDAVNESLSSVSAPTYPSTPGKFSTPAGKKTSGTGFTSASKRAGNAIIGTPKDRPFNWVVKQANSEVKALRERAEKLNWTIRPPNLDDVYLDNTPSKTIQNTQEKENETPRKILLKQNEKVLKDTLFEYRQQLEEACAVICEQDRLIHAALLGGSSSMTNHQYVEEDEDEVGGSDFEEGGGNLTPGSKLALGSSYDVSDWSFENFLPSVSPDTMAVLQESEFSTLPPPVSLAMSEE